MSMNLQLIGFFGTKKPINCKIVDWRLFPTVTIYAYFDLWFLHYFYFYLYYYLQLKASSTFFGIQKVLQRFICYTFFLNKICEILCQYIMLLSPQGCIQKVYNTCRWKMFFTFKKKVSLYRFISHFNIIFFAHFCQEPEVQSLR